jgi:hypothetical protein
MDDKTELVKKLNQEQSQYFNRKQNRESEAGKDKGKGKGKIHPITGHEDPEGSRSICVVLLFI